MEETTISLTKDEKSFLITELNIHLRNRSHTLVKEHALMVNGIYKKLTGQDHEQCAEWCKKEGD